MAVTKILAKRMRLDKLLNYVINGDKTDEGILVSYQNCNPIKPAEQMMQTKRRFGKEDGVQAYHIIQSFKPSEITPRLAHEIGCEFAREFLTDYQVCIGTHIDKGHIHSHIAFNSVSFMTGKKYTNTFKDYYQGIRKISDRLCKENGLSVVAETDGKATSYIEWRLKKAGLLTSRELLEQDIREALSYSLDYGNFLILMEERGYTIHHGKYLSFKPYGTNKAMRAKLDGLPVTEESIRAQLNGMFDAPNTMVLSNRDNQFLPRSKAKGIIALYVHYLYILGKIGTNEAPLRLTKTLRSEIDKFEKYKEQHAFLETNGIDNREVLDSYKTNLESKLSGLEKSRVILNSKKKKRQTIYKALAVIEYMKPILSLQTGGLKPDDEAHSEYISAIKALNGLDVSSIRLEKSEVYTKIADINLEIRNIKKQLALCNNVICTLPDMEKVVYASQNIDYTSRRSRNHLSSSKNI